MTDQRMPGEKGVWLLERARQFRPRIMRMLVTAYADMDAAIAAVNSGAIYKYVTKPWDPPQLEHTLKRGLEFFMVQAERDQLLREKMSVLHNMMIADRIVSLGLLAAGLSHHIRNSLVAVKTFLDLAPGENGRGKDGLERPAQSRFLEGLPPERPVADRKNQQPAQGPVDRVGQQSRDAVRRRSLAAPDRRRGAEIAARSNLPRGRSRWKTKFPIRSRRCRWTSRNFTGCLNCCSRTNWRCCPPAAASRSRRNCRTARQAGNRRPDQRQRAGPAAGRVARDFRSVRGAATSTPSEYGINLMACFFIVHHHGGKIEAQSQPGAAPPSPSACRFNPEPVVVSSSDTDFLQKALLNDRFVGKIAHFRLIFCNLAVKFSRFRQD